tara:strand:- start:2041 stop:3033 length:993 start_codon:yes stop_codon:yes gene_type:complete
MQFTSAGLLNRWGTMDTAAITTRNWSTKNRKASHNAYKDPVVLWNYPGHKPAPAPAGCHVFTSKAELQTALKEWIDNETTATEKYGEISCWDVTAVTELDLLLYGIDFTGNYAGQFNSNINNWNVSNVTSMAATFGFAGNFNQPLNKWNVSSVTNMSNMFARANSFNQDISDWDVSKVANMLGMFEGTGSEGDSDNMVFNQPLNTWNTYSLTNIQAMFSRAFNFNQPLDNWNVSKVVSMEDTFLKAVKFNQNISNWDVSKVANMLGMFENATNMSQNIYIWDVTSVRNAGSVYFQNIFGETTAMTSVQNLAGDIPDENAQANSASGDWFD